MGKRHLATSSDPPPPYYETCDVCGARRNWGNNRWLPWQLNGLPQPWCVSDKEAKDGS